MRNSNYAQNVTLIDDLPDLNEVENFGSDPSQYGSPIQGGYQGDPGQPRREQYQKYIRPHNNSPPPMSGMGQEHYDQHQHHDKTRSRSWQPHG